MNISRPAGTFTLLCALALTGCAMDEYGQVSSRGGGGAVPASASQRGGDSPANVRAGRVDGGADRRTVGAGQYQTTLAYPTGARETSVLLLEASGPQQVRVGQPYAYTVRVTNLTDTPLHDVRVGDVTSTTAQSVGGNPEVGARSRPASAADRIGATTRPAAAAGPANSAARTDPDSADHRPGQLAWNVGTLAPKQTMTREFNSVADEVGMLHTCLAVTYNPSLCIAVQVTQPELEVTKAGPSDVLLCQEIPYTYTVRNAGTGNAENVVLEDRLPEGLQTADGQQVVTANVGTLRQGESKNVTARLRAARTGAFASRATARSAAAAPGAAPAAGDSAQSREVRTTVREPVLEIDVEGPEATYVGQALNYRVTVRNTGDAAAEKTVLRLNGVGGTERLGDRDIGSIAPGASRTVNVSTRAAAGINAASLTAAAEAICAKQVSDTAKVEIRTIPALQLEVVDGQDPVQLGANTTYTITVRNEGSGPDTNVALRGTLPAELQFVRGEGSSRVSAQGQNLTFGAIPTLAPGATANWTIEVKALRPANSRFGLELNSDALGRPAVETEPTRIFDPNNPDADTGDARPAGAAGDAAREAEADRPALNNEQIDREAQAAPAASTEPRDTQPQEAPAAEPQK